MNDRSVKQRQAVEQMRRVDAICDRFEQAWQDGEQPRINEYLRHESGEDRLQLARLLLEVDIEQRKGARQPISVEDYSGEFPQLVSWLRQQLELTTGLDETPRKHGPSVVEADDPFLGTVLGSYELTEKLGAGGMGVVYRARHTMIECERAVKLLHPQISRDPATVKRFLLEAQTCITLNHPNVVTTYHVDQSTDGSIYIVMELLGGSSLDKVVTARDPMDIMDAAKIVAQAASGLAAAHRHGVIHRDIKPHNIMWNRSAAKILDLGLVRLLESESEPGPTNAGPVSTDGSMLSLFRTRLTEPNALMGTLPYMAPEQAEDAGVADERSDIYSLGCTFYFLLTGVHPFGGNSVEEIVDKHCQADFVPVSQLRQGVPERIQQILARMMDRQRDRRYQAAEAIAEDLLRWQQEAEAGAARSAVALDDLQALREAMLRLELVSSKDWETASTRVDEIEQGRVPSRLSHTMLVSDLPHADKATQMLQQLQRLQSYEGETHGLSEFQTRHIIGGNADLLRLPRHVLLNQIGNGWKGEVFAARNIAENRVEAMRTFAAGQLEGLSGIGSQRMSSFCEALDKRSQLNHAALPAILDSGSYQHRLHGDVGYFTTEYIDGTTLADLVSEGRFSDGREATLQSCIRLLIEVCQVLQHVHDQGFLAPGPASAMYSRGCRRPIEAVGCGSRQYVAPEAGAGGAWHHGVAQLGKMEFEGKHCDLRGIGARWHNDVPASAHRNGGDHATRTVATSRHSHRADRYLQSRLHALLRSHWRTALWWRRDPGLDAAASLGRPGEKQGGKANLEALQRDPAPRPGQGSYCPLRLRRRVRRST